MVKTGYYIPLYIGLWISFPTLTEQQDGTQDLYTLLFGDLNQAIVCTEFSGQVRPKIFSADGGSHSCVLCSKTPVPRNVEWAMLFPVNSLVSLVEQVEGYIQWWMELQIRFLAQMQWKKTVLNPVKLFVVLTQADPHPKFPGWTSPRALLCKLSALLVLLSSQIPLGCTVCRSYLQPSWSDGTGRHYSVSICGSAPCLGVGKLGSQAGRILGFRILNRQICTPLNFLVRVCPQIDSAGKWDCCLGLLFG